MASFSDLRIGQKVIVHDSQLSRPREGVIRVLNEQKLPDIRTNGKAGKEVGVELNDHHPLGNGLDEQRDDEGAIQWNTDGTPKTVVPEGKGWYTTAAKIETLD